MTGWPDIVLRMLLAVALSAAIGYEREVRGKVAGLRTHCLIGLGAATFTLASVYGFGEAEMARVAAGVVAGVGFIGGGVIFRGHGAGVSGLTTAASIWITSAVGLMAATGLTLGAIVVAVTTLIILELPKIQD
ncbi:MAG: MgtC/SapB family protein [Chloroflexota bacterium]